jgi:hypothetical protein
MTVTVPAASLASLLPPGYAPLPYAGDATRTSVAVQLNYQVNVQYVVPNGIALPGTYGPYNGMTISAVVLNTTTGTNQIFALAGYANNQEIVDINNSAMGVGTSRFADITFTLKDVDGLMRVHAIARDPETDLVVNVEANAPPQVTAQNRNIGPFVSQSIALGDPATIAGSAFFGVSNDSAAVPVQPGSFDVQAIRLKFVSGKLPDAVPVSASISWNVESFFRKLP